MVTSNLQVVMSAENNRKLKEIEDKILEVLSSSKVSKSCPKARNHARKACHISAMLQLICVACYLLLWFTLHGSVQSVQGNILEDETAIHIITDAKLLGNEIAEKQKVGVHKLHCVTCT